MTGDLRDHESELRRGLGTLERHTRFAEALADRESGEEVALDTKSVTPALSPHVQGVVFRAWGAGRWVEAAASSFDAAAISSAVDGLVRMLRAMEAAGGPPGESSTTKFELIDRPARPADQVQADELIAFGREALGWATQVSGVRECQVRLTWTGEERFYLNTAGASTYHRIQRIVGLVVPIAFENGRSEYDGLVLGGGGGREQWDPITEEAVRKVALGATELLRAGAPPAGEMPVLLDPSTTGTFAHESFGHGTEADQFLRDRSYLKPLLGSEVGPAFLTIADDGALAGGWGSIFSDDEGNLARKTLLVDRGRFVGALHDRETAAAYHTHATGNTRRADFLSRAFVRMTNTYTEPGDWTFEELVRETKNGVLLERATSGIEDPQGGQMQLKVKKGHRIVNGELKELVTSMALSGRVLDFLRSIRGISRKSDFEVSPGYCGKGHTDLLPAGTGGTYLLSTAVVGPA